MSSAKVVLFVVAFFIPVFVFNTTVAQENKPKYEIYHWVGPAYKTYMIYYRTCGEPTDIEKKEGIESKEIVENILYRPSYLPIPVGLRLENLSDEALTIRDANRFWYEYVLLEAKYLVLLQEGETWDGETYVENGAEKKIYKVLDVEEGVFSLEFIGYEDSSFYSEGTIPEIEDTQLSPASGTEKTKVDSLWMIVISDFSNFNHGTYRFRLTFRFDELTTYFPELKKDNCKYRKGLTDNDVCYYDLEFNIVEKISSPLKQADIELDLAYHYYVAGKYDKAISKFESMIQKNTYSVPARIGVANCLCKALKFTEEEAIWKEVINLLDNYSDKLMCKEETQVLQELVRSYLAYCLESQGKLDEAETMLLQCIELLKRRVYEKDYYDAKFANDRKSQIMHDLERIRKEK